MLPYTTSNNVKELVKEELKENAPSVLIWDKPFLSDEDKSTVIQFIEGDGRDTLTPIQTLLTKEDMESFSKYNFVKFQFEGLEFLATVTPFATVYMLNWQLNFVYVDALLENYITIVQDADDVSENPTIYLYGIKFVRTNGD